MVGRARAVLRSEVRRMMVARMMIVVLLGVEIEIAIGRCED